MRTDPNFRAELLARLRRAELRVDRSETDAEYLAARQLMVVARRDLEQFDFKNTRGVA